MKRSTNASTIVRLLVIALLLVIAVPGEVWSHGRHGHHGVRARVFVGLGPSFWWGPPYYPYWWYHGPAYYSYPVPVVQEPPVYIQQEPATAAPQAYWYYCSSSGAYYPNVQTCPEPWIKVPPRTE
jgi:hypothetical protein